MKKRTGRPPKPAKERRSEVLSVRLTKAELAKIAQKAKTQGLDPREWVRESLLQTA